jgi:hypothetical protein
MANNEQQTPVIYCNEVTARFFSRVGKTNSAIQTVESPNPVSGVALVSYPHALAFACKFDENQEASSIRRATTTWRFLTSHALGEIVTTRDLKPEAVKTYLFDKDFVVESARYASDWINKGPGHQMMQLGNKSASFLVSYANTALSAEPPVAAIQIATRC